MILIALPVFFLPPNSKIYLITRWRLRRYAQGGLLIDVSLLGGIILFGMSFFSEIQKAPNENDHWQSVIGSATGLIFLDYSALSDAYQNGFEWARNN